VEAEPARGAGAGIEDEPVRRAITSSARRRISSAVGGALLSVVAGAIAVPVDSVLPADPTAFPSV
jgi:hypothetical protein